MREPVCRENRALHAGYHIPAFPLGQHLARRGRAKALRKRVQFPAHPGLVLGGRGPYAGGSRKLHFEKMQGRTDRGDAVERQGSGYYYYADTNCL